MNGGLGFSSFKLAVLKAQMCLERYCMFLESFQIPSCQPLVSAWRYWMSEGSTSCLFYFMAFLKDIKHVFIPEFNKTQIILAGIELFTASAAESCGKGATGGGTAGFPVEFFILPHVD